MAEYRGYVHRSRGTCLLLIADFATLYRMYLCGISLTHLRTATHATPVLQFHFNEVIFSEETAMYAAEGVPTESVVFEDNAECVKLIEGTLIAAYVCVV
jgi:hypothetical protein